MTTAYNIRKKVGKLLEVKNQHEAYRIAADSFNTTPDYIAKLMNFKPRKSNGRTNLDDSLDDFSDVRNKKKLSDVIFAKQTWLSPIFEV